MEPSNNAALNINNLTSLEDDNCEIRAKTKQSMGPGVYRVTDIWQDCPDTTAHNIRNQEIGINISGYNGNINTVVGKDGCLFDTNDELRYGELTNNNSIYLLNKRENINTNPYIRGKYNVDAENIITASELTLKDKPCNSLVNSNNKVYDHLFTPMIDKLQQNVQNPQNIIFENTLGGISTRDLMRNIDHNQKCSSKGGRRAVVNS